MNEEDINELERLTEIQKLKAKYEKELEKINMMFEKSIKVNEELSKENQRLKDELIDFKYKKLVEWVDEITKLKKELENFEMFLNKIDTMDKAFTGLQRMFIYTNRPDNLKQKLKEKKK